MARRRSSRPVAAVLGQPQPEGRAASMAETRDLNEHHDRLLHGFCCLVDHAPIMVWVCDANESTVFLNRLYREFLGVEAAAGAYPPWDAAVHEEDAPVLKKTFHVAAAANLPMAFECRLKRHDGAWRHVQMHARPLPGKATQASGYIGFCFDVHERFETRDALVQSDARFRSLVEQIPAVLYMAPVNDSSRLEFVSPQVEQLLGYPAVDFLSRPDLWRSCIHPEDVDKIEFRPKNSSMATRAYVSEYRMVARDGRTHWIHDEAVMVHRPDGRPVCYQGIMLDITERRQLEETLRVYEEAVEGLDDLVAAIDARQRFIMVNRAWLEYQGKSREDVMGKHLSEVMGGRLYAEILPLVERCLQGKRMTFEAEREHPVLGRRTVSLTYFPLFGTGTNPLGMVSYLKDITDRKRREVEARRRQDQLAQAEKLVSLGTMVSGVAHEINNPNSFVMTNSATLARVWEGALPILDAWQKENGDFLLGGVLYSKQRDRIAELISGIRTGSERIRNIVDELRRFSRSEAGQEHIRLNLNEPIMAAVTLTSNVVRKATHRFSMSLATSLPLIMGSPQRLEQVLINLIQNACQALPTPECSVRVESGVDEATHRVFVRVQDEGSGIPPHLLQRICDPFFTTRRDSGGTGLGLSISARIVEEHRGEMRFDSTPGRGTTVTIYLPPAMIKETAE